MTFKPNCASTGIGSLPVTDAKEGLSLVLKYCPEIPYWPQFPNLDFAENMYVQYSEGMPSTVIDRENKKIYVDTSRDSSAEMERFYNAVLGEELDYFAIGRSYSAGIYELLASANDSRMNYHKLKAAKGQLTGPISFGLQVTDENRRPILYNDTYRDMLVKQILFKAKWMERELSKVSKMTMIFVDEPYLTALGSAVVSLDREQVKADLEEVYSGISGLKGTHCCGNTDWGLLLETSVDIIALDSFEYAKNFALYSEKLSKFLERGGMIAWGAVPYQAEILEHEDVSTLEHRLEGAIRLLESKGISKEMVLKQSLITPSCGLGCVSRETAVQALELVKELSDRMREKYSL